MQRCVYAPVICSPGPGNSGVFKALLNAMHCGDKFMVKSLLKTRPHGGQFVFPGTDCPCCKNQPVCLHGKRYGLLDTAKLKDKVSLTAF